MSMLNNVKLVRVSKPQFKKYLYDPSEFKLDYDDWKAHPDEKNIPKDHGKKKGKQKD